MDLPRLRRLQLIVLRRIVEVRAVLIGICVMVTGVRAETGLPEGFVYLGDVAPSIAQDIRYAGRRNFTGARVPGYEAAECILRRDAAEALARTQEKARALGFSLKVYDCYRPARAVRAFVASAAAPENGRTKVYYPNLRKSQLVPAYIASQSSHSTGAALDLTLIPLAQTQKAESAIGRGDCTAPASEREADDSIDMGTGFDCFDQKANTASSLATRQQRNSRMLLKSVLEAAGFRNYAGEWWHFAFVGASHTRPYDFPIKPRPRG